MKQVNLILQSKGGVGKSLLTWFLANRYSSDENVLFMDIDDSTRTSSSRLASILSSPERSLFYPILNEQKKLEREYFWVYLNGLQI
jgi:cellulose biosynthesis protein BcsQ